MRSSRNSRRRHRPILTDISLTPLIDTALTLLVIFMIASPMIHNAIRVNLPYGDAKEDKGERQDFIVYIDKANRIYFNGAQFKASDIVGELKEQVQKRPHKSIFVKADRDALCGQVFELVDRIKVIDGVQSVIFSTQKTA